MAAVVVLLVDDDFELRAILEMAASGLQDVEVLCAESGEQALAIATARPVSFVLTDFRMDGMTGLDLLRQLQENEVWPALGAVVMSGEDDDDLSDRVKSAGALDFWRKPLSAAKLRKFVGDLPTRWEK